MDDLSLRSPDQLRGVSVLMRLCADALLNEPTQGMLDATRRACAVVGLDCCNEVVCTPQLRQRFDDRFFVATSPFYVPLTESSVRDLRLVDAVPHYATVDGLYARQVVGCYQAVGFDYRCLKGFSLSVATLKPDSMACELSFMAFLASSAASCARAKPSASKRAYQLLVQFAQQHAQAWFSQAACCLRMRDDDFYAQVAQVAAWVSTGVAKGDVTPL